MEIVASSCPLGYTSDDIHALLGEDGVYGDREAVFWRWRGGQTMSICNGSTYDHDLKGYFSTACSNMLPGMPLKKEEIETLGGHGPVVYRWDLERFLLNLPVIDW
jgi:hypothetical protein